MMRLAPRYLLMLVGLALPAAAAAALAIAASTLLMEGFNPVPEESPGAAVDRFSGAVHGVALHAARAAVLTGAPLAVAALMVLLVVGGLRRYPRDEQEARGLPSVLGRLALACAALALIGLAAQLVIAANFEANIVSTAPSLDANVAPVVASSVPGASETTVAGGLRSP